MLLTTFFDAPCGSDYEGDAWIGNSHESDGAGIARHCFPWIEKICNEHGLAAADLGPGLGQTWLRIMNASTELLRWPRRDPTWGALPTCQRATPDDTLLRAWRDALADRPEDTSERPREKRRARRTPNKRRQDICPLETPYDALLQAWRDALAHKVPEGVCKHRRPKSTVRLAQETIHQKFGRVALADKRRHADRIAAKANLYARGARIRDSAKGR